MWHKFNQERCYKYVILHKKNKFSMVPTVYYKLHYIIGLLLLPMITSGHTCQHFHPKADEVNI